jgi:multiple sugar transport system ATP-binding protein
VELADGTQLDAPAHAGGVDGQPVIYGTRPEHLSLSDRGGIPSRVVVMEPTGMDTFVACRHEGTEISAVFRERHDFAPGTTIHLQPDLQRAHLFDAGTGQRLVA